MANFIDNLLFIFDRLTLVSVLDIGLVTLVFLIILVFLRNSQAIVLIRGIILLMILISLITVAFDLPAFSWLVSTALPTLLLAIPVIFAPEIRRALERLGRASEMLPNSRLRIQTDDTITTIVHAAERLSNRKHGALIILQRFDSLEEYVGTGVQMDAAISPELLLQIFFPHTPLHDGAVIIEDNRLIAAACVMPLSSSGVLNLLPDRSMGLRHRAALGASEVSDSVAVVISEETGTISVAHGGRIQPARTPQRLDAILRRFYDPAKELTGFEGWLSRLLGRRTFIEQEEKEWDD